MKKILSIALAAALMLGAASCNEKGGASKSGPLADSVSMAFGDLYGNGMGGQLKMDSTVDMKKVIRGIETILKADTSDHSYMTGLQVGMQIMQMYSGLKQQYGIDINQKVFMEHFKKALLADSTMSQEQMMALQQSLEPLMQRAASEAKQNDPKAIANKKAGEAYINKVKADKSYKTTASGLLYKVVAQGKGGETFKANDVVMTKYVGKHIDGKEFDSSKGEAVPFNLAQVIPGFREMIMLMTPGMKVEVVIPSDQAYGDTPQPNGPIGPNETLVFEIETLGVQQAPEAKPGQPAPKPAPVDAKAADAKPAKK